jgi:hypothetical protein
MVPNADNAGSLVEAVEGALLNDIVEGTAADKKTLAAYIHMEEDRTDDDTAPVVAAYLDRHNAVPVAVSLNQICFHLTQRAH